MLKKLKKSNKGVTLTSLVIYVFALTIVMAAMTTMSTFFSTGKTNEHGILKLPEINASAKPINTVDK